MSATPDAGLLASPPNLRFDGRIAWITGASRGLGRALAFAMAGAGARVVISARSTESLLRIADEVEAAGGSILPLPCSVDDPVEIAAAVSRIESEFGGLDALFNNAGVSTHFKEAEQLDLDDLRPTIETNLFGPFSCCMAALPLLEASDGASVVNVSSIHGSRGFERLISYAMSKGGLEMLTRTLAIEWAPKGIRVNSLAPAYLTTEMSAGLLDHPYWGEKLRERTPLGRFGTPAELVGCAMFLASGAATYVTGTTLFADGGWSAS